MWLPDHRHDQDAGSPLLQHVADPSFSPDPDGTVYDMAVQADGKIVIAGYFEWVSRFFPEPGHFIEPEDFRLTGIFSYMNHPHMNSPVFSLIGAAHEIERRFEEVLASVNLSGAKFSALSALVSHDQPMSLSELAAKLTCVRSNITQLVDRLEKDGLVKRTDDPADRRGVRAEVTPLGRERFAEGQKAVATVHDEVARKLAGVNQAALESALDALR